MNKWVVMCPLFQNHTEYFHCPKNLLLCLLIPPPPQPLANTDLVFVFLFFLVFIYSPGLSYNMWNLLVATCGIVLRPPALGTQKS